MTHASNLTNGVCLEDCHTNLFALADLSGIKWRRLCTDTDTSSVDILDDPALTSYCKCLSAGILAAWRRVFVPKDSCCVPQESEPLSCYKELWLFWYGEEPDFSGLVDTSLVESEQGSWEPSLSYECRTLLFKALHNLIERCLVSKGFARLGRYFIEPQVFTASNRNKKQIAFSIHFFIHGETTICASINTRLTSPVYSLSKHHISSVQNGHRELRVILSPYGLEGKLTGRIYKYSDPNIPEFLSSWYKFFPCPFKKEKLKINSDLPTMVEVKIVGAHMKYPASYVFITQEDHEEAFPSQNQALNCSSSSLYTSGKNPAPTPVPCLLTPPMSPRGNLDFKDASQSIKDGLNHALTMLKDNTFKIVDEMSYVIKHSVGQECHIPTVAEKSDETSSVLWDIQDPSAVTKCTCSRNLSQKKHHFWNSRGLDICDRKLNFHDSSNGTHHRNQKIEKIDYFFGIPFHRLNNFREKICLSDSNISSIENSHKPRNESFSVSMLPQLQTSMVQSKNKSLKIASEDHYYFQAKDPIMPTLSPQTPVIKEENCSEPFEIPHVNVSSPANCFQPVIKERTSEEILTSSNVASLSARTEPKLELGLVDSDPALLHSDGKRSSLKAFEKPSLQKRSLDIDDDSELTMKSFLYNYSHFDSDLWQSSAAKRKRLNSLDAITLEMEDDLEEPWENSYVQNARDIGILKDPYEFTEYDDTTPSERNFRQRAELCKEEEKFSPSPGIIPSSPAPLIPLAQETLLSHVNDGSKTPSPATTKNLCPKFIREEDLAVSFNDLDNIFDTSSDDEEENIKTPATPSKITSFDEFTGKIELSRMYPTPPSLEQNAVPSPFSLAIGNDGITVENDTKETNTPNIKDTDLQHEDVSIWMRPMLYKFVESPKYSFVTALAPDVQIKSNFKLIYKSSCVQPLTKMNCGSLYDENLQLNSEGNSSHQLYPGFDEDQASHSFCHSESAANSCVSQTFCDDISPSSIHSYYSKNINSIEGGSLEHKTEIQSLVVNLLLSDSMLNVFKDHNFDCCCLCVCDMNIKGSDVGILLPNSLVPLRSEESSYNCTCGFSAVVHRHRSFNAGLFIEDELEIIGFSCDSTNAIIHPYTRLPKNDVLHKEFQKKLSSHSDVVPDFILDMLRVQCKSINSSFSLFHKSQFFSNTTDNQSSVNAIEFYDGSEICFMALEEGKNSVDNLMACKLEESLKSSCLHKWPYVSSPMPSSNQDLMVYLENLKPLLQAAVHKKNTQRLWDITYVVSGPLTWKEFHTLAARGTEDQCEPQPIPSVLVGQDLDCVALSPFALKFWDKLHLEPYSLPRNVAYIAVAPENDVVLSHVKNFFKELSSTYELLNLGKHCPITKVLRDGIMRVGKTAASKVAEEPVSEWFNTIGDGPVSNKLKLYARVCKHRLAPHLSTLTLDKSIFKNSNSSRSSEKHSGNFPSVSTNDNTDKPLTPKSVEIEGDSLLANSTCLSQESSEDDTQQPPSIVIYIIEPFTFADCDPNVYRLVTMGLIHSYADMLSCLPDGMKNSIHLQLLSLDSIMCFQSGKGTKKDEMKALSFSVYSQSHNLYSHQSGAKSVTGFGPSAAQDVFLRKNNQLLQPFKVYNQPFVLASVKDKQTELGEMFGDRQENSGVLYCSYCLTKDKRFILACCTNDKGEFTETNIINIGVPDRHKRKHTSVRKFGLSKLLDFILEVISMSVRPWRLIIERFGRLGHGELKAWASLLSRKSMTLYTKRLKEMCQQCRISNVGDVPCILSVCLVSLEPDSSLRLVPDHLNMGDCLNGSHCKTCNRKSLNGATCTHILVFPTSATTQFSQSNLHQEHIDPLPGGLGEELFDALNDDDITGADINDIFKWTESPGNSPHRNNSEPSSPSASFRVSSHQNRYESIHETQDEFLQLLQQPLALGYYVSTAKTGLLPKWFWASCPHLENKSPVFLKSALLIHFPYVQQSSDDLLHNNSHQMPNFHPLDSNYTTDVLRYVLEGYNSLSWLALDSSYHDRRSCLPIHIQMLMQLYNIVEATL